MSTRHSGYPVGAMWEAVAENGSRAWYWLESRSQREGHPYQFYEVWKWGCCYSDGTLPRAHHSGDWGTTRNSVMDEVGYKKLGVCGDLKKWSRFKRVKEQVGT